MGRELTDDEVDLYDLVPRQIALRARLHTVHLLPNGANGMTLGRHVLLRRGHERNEALIAHELVHVRQFAGAGSVRFLGRYVYDYARQLARLRNHRRAYRAIPAEVAARAAATEWSARHPETVGKTGGREAGRRATSVHS